jgi:flagellar basal-body rod modification protein FlgD
MSSAISPLTSHAQSDSAAQAAEAATSTAALGNEDTFLQLLVAQIQNQDPTAPMDSTTFLTQLASFSQLEQLIKIRQDTDQLSGSPGSTSSTTGS